MWLKIVFSPRRACKKKSGLHTLLGERATSGFVKERTVFCETYSYLLEKNVVATVHYHQAITKLSQLAGGNERDAFNDAMGICKECLKDCRRTSCVARAHRADHGC